LGPNDPRCAHSAARKVSVFAGAFADECNWQSLLSNHQTSASGTPSLDFSDRRTVKRVALKDTRANRSHSDSAQREVPALAGVLVERHESQALFPEHRRSALGNSSRRFSVRIVCEHFDLPDTSADRFRIFSALGAVPLPHRALLNDGKENLPGHQFAACGKSFAQRNRPERGANWQPLFNRAGT
jgi:hypothetical protein